MASQREADGNMACQLRMDVRDESGKHLFHAALAFVIEPAESEALTIQLTTNDR